MKILVGVCVFNEENRIEAVLKNLEKTQTKEKFDVVIGNDGSTDKSLEICSKYAKRNNWKIISHSKNTGIGTIIRDFINYGIKEKYDILTVTSGNGKVSAQELKRMYKPVVEEGYDYVKGSRYIKGGESENLPLFRKIMIPAFSFIVSIFMRRKVTDVTCLVNALKLEIFEDEKINISQEWLDKYELEYYILYYVLKRKYKFKEVPLTISYPEEKKNYTKIKPFVGWWSMIRPWVFLILRIKK